MVQLDFLTALKVYDGLPEEQKSPYSHPIYVVTDALRDRSLETVFFVYREGGEFFYYPFHLGAVTGTPFYDIQSPYAYGGPLSSTSGSAFLSRAWQSYLSWCQEHNILAEFVRFHPCIENHSYYPGEIQPMRETVWVDLQSEDYFSVYTTRVRTAIRKAQKNGLRVTWANDSRSHQAFTALYTQAMDRLQADSFYYFPADYFRQLQAWKQTHLALCWQGETLLAAALFLQESHIMEYHLAAATPEGNKSSASNLLLHEAALLAKKLGCKLLHLGGGTDNSPDNALLFFKSGFSPERAKFQIGKIIHAPEAYEEIKNEWQDKHGQCSDKVLFYRFAPR